MGNITELAEANVYGDPLAAQIVFNCGTPVTLAPLNCTHRQVMSAQYFEELAETAGEVGKFLQAAAVDYFNFYKSSVISGTLWL